MRARKKITRDMGNGLMAFCLVVDPADIPSVYALAPQQSAVRLLVSYAEQSHLIHALKAPTVDNGDGSAGLVLHLSAIHSPAELLYLPKGAHLEVSLTMEPELDPGMFPVTPEERVRLLKTVAILCCEEGFRKFIQDRDDPDGLIALADRHELDIERAVVEALLRRIGAHSRAEIASNFLVAERAERVIRSYRASRWCRDSSYLAQSRPESRPAPYQHA